VRLKYTVCPNFFIWSSIFQSAFVQDSWKERFRHVAYAGGWKKFEPLWDWVIRLRRVNSFLPVLESILEGAKLSLRRQDTQDRFEADPASSTNQTC
jgi:hypothetical protein